MLYLCINACREKKNERFYLFFFPLIFPFLYNNDVEVANLQQEVNAF